jgi:hypothetical protein
MNELAEISTVSKGKLENDSMSKKVVERFYLENFLKLLGETNTQIDEGESPDFIVTLRGKRIGIEVTEFHSDLKGAGGKPRRVIEETWDLLQKNLKKAVEKHPELKGTHGFLMFKDLIVPPKSVHKKFIDEVIQLSIDMICTNSEEIRADKRKFPFFNQYLEKFRLKRINFPHHISWDWNQNASSIGLTEHEFINAIQSKMKKAHRYRRKRIEELWLLIISGYRLSQAMPPPEFLGNQLNDFYQLNDLLKTSGYNRVYLYQYMFDAIYKWPGWIKLLTVKASANTAQTAKAQT